MHPLKALRMQKAEEKLMATLMDAILDLKYKNDDTSIRHRIEKFRKTGGNFKEHLTDVGNATKWYKLYLILETNSPKAVSLLIDHEIKPDTILYRQCAFIHAIGNAPTENLMLYLKKSVNHQNELTHIINLQDDKGNTVLHKLAETVAREFKRPYGYDKEEIETLTDRYVKNMQFFLANGADLLIENNEGQTPGDLFNELLAVYKKAGYKDKEYDSCSQPGELLKNATQRQIAQKVQPDAIKKIRP
jgi:hypothetical protein